MVITRSVLSEIIKDEYEKLLTEAVEEAACGTEEGAVEEGHLEEAGLDSVKQLAPYVLSALAVGTVLTKLSMDQTQAIDYMLNVATSPDFDPESFEPYLAPAEKAYMDKQGISKAGNEQAYRVFMAGPAIRIAQEGQKAEVTGNKKIPVVKQAATVAAPKAATKGPARPVVPASQRGVSPKGGVKVQRETSFPRPKTAAPKA